MLSPFVLETQYDLQLIHCFIWSGVVPHIQYFGRCMWGMSFVYCGVWGEGVTRVVAPPTYSGRIFLLSGKICAALWAKLWHFSSHFRQVLSNLLLPHPKWKPGPWLQWSVVIKSYCVMCSIPCIKLFTDCVCTRLQHTQGWWAIHPHSSQNDKEGKKKMQNIEPSSHSHHSSCQQKLLKEPLQAPNNIFKTFGNRFCHNS